MTPRRRNSHRGFAIVCSIHDGFPEYHCCGQRGRGHCRGGDSGATRPFHDAIGSEFRGLAERAGLIGLTTLCGLYDGAGGFLNDGFPREFAGAILEAPPLRMGKLWVLPYRPERFREVADELLRASKVRAVWNKPLTHATTLQDVVVALNGLPAGAVIDCTGRRKWPGRLAPNAWRQRSRRNRPP